jgi:DNA-binding MarR family transcriptional regulator
LDRLIISTTDDQLIHRIEPVSTQNRVGGPPAGPPPLMADRLGYLLKHAQLQFFELTATMLAPIGINGQEAIVLRAINGPDPLSQGEVARRMGIDRTTMVALIDELEQKGLVLRRQDLADRRKNVVGLTGAGRDTLRRANQAGQEAERRFLSPLPAGEQELFKNALRALLSGTDRA